MRPLGLPWGTFAAFIVVAASIIASIVWSVRVGPARGDDAGEGGHE